MKYLTILFLLILLNSCSNETGGNKESDFYPENESLFRITNKIDSNSYYYFFPNDSTVLTYMLRKWTYESPQRQTELGSDFHAFEVFIKDGKEYNLYRDYTLKKANIEIQKNESSYAIEVKYNKTGEILKFDLEKTNEFESLPSDPRSSWIKYYNEFCTDTVSKFTPINNSFKLIKISGGKNLDTIHLDKYDGKVNYTRKNDNDTFLMEIGSNRIFVFPKSYITQKLEVVGGNGSFDVELINKEDSLAMNKLKEMVKKSEEKNN